MYIEGTITTLYVQGYQRAHEVWKQVYALREAHSAIKDVDLVWEDPKADKLEIRVRILSPVTDQVKRANLAVEMLASGGIHKSRTPILASIANPLP